MKSTAKALLVGGSLLFGSAALAAGATAAKKDDKAAAAETKPADTKDTKAADAKPADAKPTVTDPQIAAIVVAANTVDIDAGKFAKSKTKNKDVKAFASQMVTDHTSVNKQAVALVKKLKVTPEENDTSKALKAGGVDNLAKLKGLKGAELDQAYIDHEVEYHQQVLDAVDNTLIPSATNEELKALLVKVRPAFEAHLEHAKKVQATLSASTAK